MPYYSSLTEMLDEFLQGLNPSLLIAPKALSTFASGENQDILPFLTPEKDILYTPKFYNQFFLLTCIFCYLEIM